VCPELPGCASAGESEEEARANIREAIELYLTPGDLELPENAKLVEVTVG
jgi:predicted RNase H-like HicB family nuclease